MLNHLENVDSYLKYKLFKYINENNLNNIVKIIKYNSNPYVYLNKSDIFVLTSKYEGLPNVLLESIYLNKLIFSFDCKTGPREILYNGKLGVIVKLNDYKKLSIKILNYFNSKKKYKYTRMKKLAFKSLKRFNYYKQLNKYLVIVNKYLT